MVIDIREELKSVQAVELKRLTDNAAVSTVRSIVLCLDYCTEINDLGILIIAESKSRLGTRLSIVLPERHVLRMALEETCSHSAISVVASLSKATGN